MSLQRWDSSDAGSCDDQLTRFAATSSESLDSDSDTAMCPGCTGHGPCGKQTFVQNIQKTSFFLDHGLLSSHPDLNPRSSSGASTSMSESGTDSDNDGCSADPIIDLTYERLQSLHANGTVCTKDLTEYAKRGISGRRIKSAVLHPQCRCMCKMPVKVLYHLCVAFWTLTKPTQDSLLWGIQNESGKQKRKRWYLAGQLSPSKQVNLHQNTVKENVLYIPETKFQSKLK